MRRSRALGGEADHIAEKGCGVAQNMVVSSRWAKV